MSHQVVVLVKPFMVRFVFAQNPPSFWRPTCASVAVQCAALGLWRVCESPGSHVQKFAGHPFFRDLFQQNSGNMWKKLKNCRTKRHQTREEYLITLTRLKDYIRFWFNRAPPLSLSLVCFSRNQAEKLMPISEWEWTGYPLVIEWSEMERPVFLLFLLPVPLKGCLYRTGMQSRLDVAPLTRATLLGASKTICSHHSYKKKHKEVNMVKSMIW